MIVPMKRARIAAPQERAKEVIHALGKLGVFHISDPEKDPVLMFEDLASGFLSQEISGALAEAEALIQAVSSALSALPPAPETGSPAAPLPEEEWLGAANRGHLHRVAESISALSGRLEAAVAERKEVRAYRNVFLEFSSLIEVAASSLDVDLVGVSFPREGARAMEELETALDKATAGAFSIFKSKSREDAATALIVIPASLRDTVSEKVFAGKIHPIHLPERFARGAFASTLAALMERDRELETLLAALREDLAEAAARHRAMLAAALEGIRGEMIPLRAQERLLRSSQVLWISGWVPEDKADLVAGALEARFGVEALVYMKTPGIGEWPSAPVRLANPGWARPFERMVDLYSPPVYGSVDPTAFLAVSFPLFFGMIMGDVGHAALLALVGYGVSRIPGGGGLAKDAASIIYRMAGAAAVFGLIFGEAFGGPPGGLWPFHPIYDRKEGVGGMLAAVIFLGFFHVASGAALGGVNAFRRRHWPEVAEKVADVALLAGIFFFGWRAAQGADAGLAGWAIAGALGLKVAAGRSLKSALEAPKLVSNILSYARLMALGLASIALADLANGFMGAGAMAGGMAAGVFFHLLNFVIGVVSPAIQAARLHFVEFFTQFYEPAGERYRPLAEPIHPFPKRRNE